MHKLKGFYPLLGGATLLAVLATLTYCGPALAETSGWLAPSPLYLQEQMGFTNPPPSKNGNIDCTQDGNGCYISVPYGYASQNSTVRLDGASSFNEVISYVDNRAHYLPIPNSDQFISYTTEPPYGLYLYFTSGFHSAFIKTTSFGVSQYKIIRAPNGKLADKNGHRLAGDPVSMSFSENGQWMLVTEPNVATLRVNLSTLEVLPFGPSYNYTIGLSPSPHTAISNDGRFAVVSSKDFNNFSIYDLSTCPSLVPATINGPLNCQYRDLGTFLSQRVPGFMTVSNLRFISNDTLGTYVSYRNGSSTRTAKYIISNSGGQIHQQDLIALGDSYISGEGVFSYRLGTDTPENKCHLSTISYPFLMGLDLSLNSYHSVACSGAKTEDIVNTLSSYRNQLSSNKPRSQYTDSEINNFISVFQPGVINQLEFVKRYQPKKIIVSVAGNDIGFAGILAKCLVQGTCYDKYEDRLELVRLINRSFNTLADTYTKIKNHAPADAKIYIIGYPQIAKMGGYCDKNVHLNSDEIVFSTQLIDYLDNVIEAASHKAGVVYIDTQHALDGHRLCEAGPGSVAVNGLTAGNDFPDFLGGPIGKETYHPNDFGHQLLDQYILLNSSRLSQPMPMPDLDAALPSESGLDILKVAKSNRTINVIKVSDNLAPDIVYRSMSFNTSLDGSKYLTKPSSPVRAILNSETVDLGSYTTDSNGDLNSQLIIPGYVEPGIHTLHLYGTDIAGQPIDIYKVIFLAASPTDYDGDGVPNTDEVCGVIEPAGQDFDEDGIDDACDPNISKPPIRSMLSLDSSPKIAPKTNNLSTKVMTVASSLEYGADPFALTEPSSRSYKEATELLPSKVLGTHTSKPGQVMPTSQISSRRMVVIIITLSILCGILYWKLVA